MKTQNCDNQYMQLVDRYTCYPVAQAFITMCKYDCVCFTTSDSVWAQNSVVMMTLCSWNRHKVVLYSHVSFYSASYLLLEKVHQPCFRFVQSRPHLCLATSLWRHILPLLEYSQKQWCFSEWLWTLELHYCITTRQNIHDRCSLW